VKVTLKHLEKAVNVLGSRISYLLTSLKQTAKDVRGGSHQLRYLLKPYSQEIIALKGARQILMEQALIMVINSRLKPEDMVSFTPEEMAVIDKEFWNLG
jgi:hypothetical protein